MRDKNQRAGMFFRVVFVKNRELGRSMNSARRMKLEKISNLLLGAWCGEKGRGEE